MGSILNLAKVTPIFFAGFILFLPASAHAEDTSPPFATPIFPQFLQDQDANDYRPVLNAEGTVVIFERTFKADPKVTKLYSGNFVTHQVSKFVDIASTRADWCWLRSSGSLITGPVAFSNDDGIYRVDVGSSEPKLLLRTKGMIYPSWYPDCQFLAVDVGENVQTTGKQITAKIDATTGNVVTAPLANDRVWAGFPSVNQINPSLVAFAGQFKGKANYYDQDLNYIWVTNRTFGFPLVTPMDRKTPPGPGFLQQFQARAGWWSPDGKWFAFESNRICDNLAGSTYAIFIQDAAGLKPAMQVTSCDWNAQHPKWFPLASTGNKVMLIAAVAHKDEAQNHIAVLDVTAFVQGH
jgi:Tol biopolymer transport system component